ncbi:MAG: hypothetical protein H8E34_13690 [Bacteroidetes bacterium]|nr:hypothetical protein [Bacteroidota bacterium]MBL6944218.1 hypothetical protein [Bacteroidales bacterium]
MKKILFKEEQKFGSMPLYFFMGGIYAVPVIFFLIASYHQFVLKQPWGDKPISDTGFLLTAFLVTIVLVVMGFLLFSSKLEVEVTNESLNITFKPYFSKPRIYNKSNIEKFEIREYKPISEYGGWGVKQGKKGIGKAYNVRGKIGLQLYLKNRKKVLIGTQRGDALLRSMKKMMEVNK